MNFPVEPQVPSFIESKFIVENLQIGMRNRNESNLDGTCRFNQVSEAIIKKIIFLFTRTNKLKV